MKLFTCAVATASETVSKAIGWMDVFGMRRHSQPKRIRRARCPRGHAARRCFPRAFPRSEARFVRSLGAWARSFRSPVSNGDALRVAVRRIFRRVPNGPSL
nr:MAG: hypothetical protein DIU78_24590 [Pseudomonadota bacterium]